MLKQVWLVFVMSSGYIHAQKFNGVIKDKNTKDFLSGVAVICSHKKIGYKFTFTNDKGQFSIPIYKQIDSLLVEVKLFGYKTYKQKIKFDKKRNKTVFLEESQEKLQEIIIESKRKILINRDTVNYRISGFLDRTETNVEDVLKKLPGIEVDEGGAIRIGGKEIEKILIEGDDLTAKNYKLLSKNLDASLLKSVQVLRNYDENPIRKQIKQSKKVALNLLIKDNKRNVFFGFLKTGLATQSNYDIKASLGLLSKKFKILNLNSFNTIGEKSVEEKNYNFNNDFDIDDNVSQPLIKEATNVINSNKSYFKSNETILNNSKVTSITFNKKIRKDLKVRFLGMLEQDKTDFENQTQITFIDKSINRINESAISLEHDKEYSGNIELRYFKNNTYLTYLTQVGNLKKDLQENLLFNNKKNIVYLFSKNRFHNHHIKLTNKLGTYSLLRNYIYYQKNNGKEQYAAQKGFFNGNEEVNLVQQTNLNSENIGWKVEFLKQANVHGFSLNSIIDNTLTKFDNSISENTNLLYDFFNEISHFNFKTRANYFFQKNRRKKLTLRLHNEVHSIEDQNSNKNFNLLGYGLTYNIYNNKIGNFTFSYSFKPELLNANSFFKVSILKNYRKVNVYDSAIEKVNNSNFSFGHNFQLINKGFISFSNISYSKFSKSILINSVYTNGYVNNQFNFTNRVGSLVFFQNQTSKYLSRVNTSFKVDNSFTKLISFYALNNSVSKNINYGYTGKLTGTTYFKSKLNYEFLFQYDKSWNKVDDLITENENFITRIKVKCKIKKRLTFTIDWNNYWLNNNYHNLTHVNVIFKPLNSKFDYKFTAHNIFNNNSINTYQLNEFNTISNRTKIIPNYYMLMVNYRF